MQMWFKRLNIFSDFNKSHIQCLSSILQRGVRPSSGESEENLVLRHISDGAVYIVYYYYIIKQWCRVCWCFHFTFLPFYFILSRIQKMKTSITTLRKGLWMKVMLSLSSRAPCRLEGAPVALSLVPVLSSDEDPALLLCRTPPAPENMTPPPPLHAVVCCCSFCSVISLLFS